MELITTRDHLHQFSDAINKHLVVLGELYNDTTRECKMMLKELKQKLKEIFHVKRITPLIEMGGSVMI